MKITIHIPALYCSNSISADFLRDGSDFRPTIMNKINDVLHNPN